MWIGPMESRDPKAYRKMTTQAFDLVASEDHSNAVKASVYLLSEDPIYMYGDGYYWVAIVVHGLEPAYMRVNPLTERL